jgi:hypothetical protein
MHINRVLLLALLFLLPDVLHHAFDNVEVLDHLVRLQSV